MNPGITGSLAEYAETLLRAKEIIDMLRSMGGTELLLLLAIVLTFVFRRHFQVQIRRLKEQHNNEIRQLICLLSTVAKDHSRVPEEGLYGNRVKLLFKSHRVRAAVDHILDLIRHQIELRLKYRGIDLQGDVAVTLKVALHRSFVPQVLPRLKKKLQTIPSDENYVLVTFARDPSTMRALPRREVRDSLFTINANAAFNGLIMASKPLDCFACDDLASLQQYFNETEDWHKFYNATLVVPIFGGAQGGRGPNIKGFLCIDSRNKNKAKVYSDPAMKELAILFAEILRTYILACTGGLIPPTDDKSSVEH